jgi:hypothetical protein
MVRFAQMSPYPSPLFGIIIFIAIRGNGQKNHMYKMFYKLLTRRSVLTG